MLQQEPWAQLPQTVLPNLAPQLPSTVGTPVGFVLAGVDGLPRTGSPVLVTEGGRVLDGDGAGAELAGALSLQPF